MAVEQTGILTRPFFMTYESIWGNLAFFTVEGSWFLSS